MKKPCPLKLERELRGWSQARVAAELQVTSRTIARWEQGQATPYPYYRERLCSLFEKNAYELGLSEVEDDEQQAVVPAVNATISPASSSFLFDPIIPEAPGDTTSLLGRDALLDQIKHRLLQDKSLALTALNGLPGIGKTALAVALATDRQIQAHYCDGILWAGLGPHPNMLSMLTRWGALLGIEPGDVENATSLESWWHTLSATVGSRRMLIVIDDVWSAEEALLLKIGGINCAHLITTRSPQVGFAFAQEGTIVVPELEAMAGLALLAHFVPQFVAQDEEAAVELVRTVGGLPLAIKLMGHYLASQAFAGQPRRLRTAITTLQDAQKRLAVSIPSKWHELPPGLPKDTPLSLQAAIAVSDQHLSKQAHSMLCTLAVLPAKPNSFSEEAALAISQEPVEMLDELWDAGLLEGSGSGRYMLHQTIVDYAHSQRQDAQARQQLVYFVVQFLQTHEHDYRSIEVEANNLQAGLDMALALGMHDELVAGITSFVAYMRVRGRYALADYYLQRALKATMQKSPQESMLFLQCLADFSELRGEYDEAERYSQQGLELARQQEHKETMSALLTTRGNVALHRGDYAQAQVHFEEGLQIVQQLDDKKQICMLLCSLGRVARHQTHYTRAKALLLEGLTLARQQDYQEIMIPLLTYLGEVARYMGDYSESEQYGLESLSLARQLQHYHYLSLALNSLGASAWARGNIAQAETYFLEGLEVARQIGHREQICRVLANLGVISTYPFQKKYSQAEQYLREGIDLARHIQHNNTLPILLTGLGITVGMQGDYEQANLYLQESVEIARRQHAPWHVITALTCWGLLHLRYQHIDEAAAAFQEVLAIDKNSQQDPQMVASARYQLATILARRGESAEAYRLGQESLVQFEATRNYMAGEVRRWLQGLVEKEPQLGADHPDSRQGEQKPDGSPDER